MGLAGLRRALEATRAFWFAAIIVGAGSIGRAGDVGFIGGVALAGLAFAGAFEMSRPLRASRAQDWAIAAPVHLVLLGPPLVALLAVTWVLLTGGELTFDGPSKSAFAWRVFPALGAILVAALLTTWARGKRSDVYVFAAGLVVGGPFAWLWMKAFAASGFEDIAALLLLLGILLAGGSFLFRLYWPYARPAKRSSLALYETPQAP